MCCISWIYSNSNTNKVINTNYNNNVYDMTEKEEILIFMLIYDNCLEMLEQIDEF